MTTEHPAISAAGWLERLAQLAVRQGVRIATLQQKDGRDLELVFATASLFSRPTSCSTSAAPTRY